MSATFLVIAITLGAPGPKEPKVSPIVGTWHIVSQTQDGTTREVTGEYCWTFTADGRRGAHTLKTEQGNWQRCDLNEKTRPPSLAVVHEESGGRESWEHFLYEIDGDTLRLCTSQGARPTAITAEEGSRNVIYTLKRVPKKE